MAVNPVIIEALRRLNPAVPAGDQEYVDRDLGEGHRGWDQPERLEVLLSAGYTVRAVLHGAIGVGKSTELRRWLRHLSADYNIAGWDFAGIDPSTRDFFLGQPGFAVEVANALCSTWDRWAKAPVDRDPRTLNEIRQVAAESPRPLLAFVDGSDLLSDTGAETILGHLAAILGPEVRGLVCVAPHVAQALHGNASLPRGYEHQWHLPAFPVIDEHGQPDPQVIAHLASGLDRRLADLDAFEDRDLLLREAARYSGGLPRDAVRILHGALLAAARAGKVNSYHLTMGLREVRQDLAQALRLEDWTALRTVAETGNHLGAHDLVARNAIIAYETAERRYWRPHPLLEAMLDDPRLGGAGATR